MYGSEVIAWEEITSIPLDIGVKPLRPQPRPIVGNCTNIKIKR